MGAVFAAHDPQLDRRVAIKVLSARPDEASRARLVREAKALARLNHPHVLQIYELGEHDGDLWIVTEFVDGMDLRTFLRREAHTGWRARLRLCAAVADGLAAAHSVQLTHCDVKPENILIDGRGRPRVADFGLARLRAYAEGEASQTASSSALGSVQRSVTGGTPGYVAPEVLDGSDPGPKSDQYGFFMVVRDAMAGCEPQSSALSALLERGTATDPEARWPSMDLIADELARIADSVDDESATWGPGSTSSPQSQPMPVLSGRRKSADLPLLDARIHTLLEIITASTTRVDLRRSVLAWVDKHVGFDTALLGRAEVVGPEGPMVLHFDQAFLTQFAAAPERYGAALGKLAAASASSRAAICDVDVYSLSERGKLPFYTELIGSKGSKAMSISTLMVGQTPVGSLQFSRSSRGARFTDKEMALVTAALPLIAMGEARFSNRP